jgi:hypothetical protein
MATAARAGPGVANPRVSVAGVAGGSHRRWGGAPPRSAQGPGAPPQPSPALPAPARWGADSAQRRPVSSLLVPAGQGATVVNENPGRDEHG